ncbi:MAG: Monofunctional biosynthetic peptidoglycan transglycosylase [uncultured Sphingosinicella sp.]|uniref:Biosynthetic peptidoglycan transglycosylase n=1 Tax=uncultured Sphingosinicella sp. TaxID=478748 RepID=A0A6J4UGK0_9SPHN|nr:MAG: Monofunctional biosynthetic peptidoglycan transglycosylase [uncultured Sphingosinicella sp.]
MIGWVFRAFFLFIVISLLWVLLYRFVPPPITFTMMGDALSGRGVTKDWMSLDQIDRDMARAAIAAEDSKFCSHWGFDQDAIAAAMRRNAEGRGVMRGGSTISQQTAKNAFLWQGGGYFRKGLEAWFTLLIENLWSKQRIMEVYLNIAETGLGTYGANAGAQRYFKKDASNLTRQEAARIAAVLPLPKEREAIAPSGFTRRYGNSISKRIGVVTRDGLDACLQGSGSDTPEPRESKSKSKSARPKAGVSSTPDPQPERVEDYISSAPVAAEPEPAVEPVEQAPAEQPEPEAEPLPDTPGI